MAYHLHHTCTFINCLNENLLIELYKKDVVPNQVTTLLANSFAVNIQNGFGDKFDAMLISEAELNFTLYASDNLTFADFLVTFPDEWKLVAYNDGQTVFAGFLTPGIGKADFQDKPYDVTLSAVDGIALLKGTPLTKDNGDNFTGVNLIIDYVIAILNKTGLDLNLRLFSNITEQSMQDRTQNPNADTFNQTALHARTFLKNAIEFYDCYTCLERILAEYFTVYQWNGKWVILRIGELQESVGAKMWYTDYDASGTVIGAAQYLEDPAAVGRDRLIHPVDVNQFISTDFAIKSSRYNYSYSVWPEMPTNNKFEQGTLFEEGSQADIEDFDGDGDTTEIIGTYKKYTIDNWEQGRVSILDFPHPAMTPIAKKFYRASMFNEFGVEIQRAVVCETDVVVDDTQFWMRSEAIPVNFGDKIRVGWQRRFDNNFASSVPAAAVGAVYIVSDDNSQVVTLRTDGVWIDGTNPVFGLLGRIIISYVTGQDSSKWNSIDVSSEAIPFSGNLYIAHVCEPSGSVVNPGTRQYWKDFVFEYYPYIAGGFVPVKSDYAETSQNTNFKDVIDVSVYISDSLKKVLQGTLYREDLITLTTPTWHRYGVDEQRHFKELGELARFNANYRRMWRMEGTYDGLKFTPASNATFIEPLSFHRQFTFPDATYLNGHYFVLVPPLLIDYGEGRAEMNFAEVLQAGTNDGNDLGDNHIPLKYVL